MGSKAINGKEIYSGGKMRAVGKKRGFLLAAKGYRRGLKDSLGQLNCGVAKEDQEEEVAEEAKEAKEQEEEEEEVEEEEEERGGGGAEGEGGGGMGVRVVLSFIVPLPQLPSASG